MDVTHSNPGERAVRLMMDGRGQRMRLRWQGGVPKSRAHEPAVFSVLKGRKLAFPTYREDVFTWILHVLEEAHSAWKDGKPRYCAALQDWIRTPLIYSVQFVLYDVVFDEFYQKWSSRAGCTWCVLELLSTNVETFKGLSASVRLFGGTLTLTSRGDHRPLPRSAGLPLVTISSAQKKAKQCGRARFDLMWCGIAICHSRHLDTYQWQKKE